LKLFDQGLLSSELHFPASLAGGQHHERRLQDERPWTRIRFVRAEHVHGSEKRFHGFSRRHEAVEEW